MKKKILSVLLTAALLTALASCSGKKEEDASTTTAPSEAPETTQLTSGTTDAEDAPNPEPTTDADEEGDPDAAEQSDCQRLTDAVLKSPSLEEVATMQANDESMLTDVMGYDLSLFSEYSVVTHLMSAHLVEIVVAKPADGKKQEALDLLEQRKEKLINEVAFYPEQQENADATIIGEAADGKYVYLLCATDSAELEETLLSALE